MKKLFRNFWETIGAVVAFGLVCGCSSMSKRNVDVDAQMQAAAKILLTMQYKYAPDPHMAIFRVEPSQQGDYFILRGEVDNAEAKDELVQSLKSIGVKAVDKITVLPSEKMGPAVWGIVCISVANIREEPKPSAELGSQALMGQVIRLWKQQGNWCYVQTADQYLGWMEDDSFVQCTKEKVNEWNSSERVIVTSYEDRIWPKVPDEDTFPVTDIVTGGLVKKTGEEGDWDKVELPDGRTGCLAKKSVMDFEQWRNTRHATPDSIARTAMSFTGFPYLWGGTSSKGMDCSGFTKTVFLLNGIQLNRNASQQVHQGMEIEIDPELKNLKRGDLLFFGHKSQRGERITHVGLYLGDKMFIQSSGMVKLSSLDPKSALLDERRLKSLVHVRRILLTSNSN